MTKQSLKRKEIATSALRAPPRNDAIRRAPPHKPMPLDLKKVIVQLKNIENNDVQNINRNRLDSTFKLFELALSNQEELKAKLYETQESKKANFFFAVPYSDGSLEQTISCNENFLQPHITVATDGSQISPSAHEVTGSFLINIGLVSIPYFAKDIPVNLSSEPTIYNSQEEISPKTANENIQEDDLISYERTLKEIEELVKLAKSYSKYSLPIIAILDGTLIHWHIEKFSSYFIENFIKRFSDAMHELKSLRIPVASFLSNSRSNDLINMLRIYKCPYESVDCKKHCANLDSRNLPCNPCPDYAPVLDRRLVEKYFSDKKIKSGTRTVLFKSNSKVFNHYPDDLKVSFFYMNTGSEIARVEIPSYVANDKDLLDLTHNAVALQCKVGFGYPVTLSEAHLQAVVNKADRQVFYDLIKERLLKGRQMPVRLSNKELKKRVSFV